MTHPFQPGDRIFAYLRDSGHENQELSIAQQRRAIQEWADENGLIVTQWFIDEARPGSSVVGRDALQELMRQFRRGCPERGVIVWKYNRFARDIDNAQYYRAEIRSRGYEFASLNETIPEGPMGRVFEAIIDFKDEQFLLDLSTDVKRGLRNLVLTHGCVPGVPPRGLKRERVIIGTRRDGTPHIAHRWVPDPEVAPLVRQAFEMRAAGATIGQIHEKLHLFASINGYTTLWPRRIYYGTLEYADLIIENYCEPIVDKATWDAVQKIQARYKKRHHLHTADHPRRRNSRFLLSGIGHCARCGAPLYGHSSKQRSGKTLDSYYCTASHNKRTCSRRRIPRQAAETAVIETLLDHLLTPENLSLVAAELRAGQAERIAAQQAELKRIKNQLARVRRQITNLTNAIAESGHSRALLARLTELESRESDLIARQNAAQQRIERPIPEIDPDELESAIRRLKHTFQNADLATQRDILRGLIHRVDIDRDGKRIYGTIYYYYPPDFNPESPSSDGDSVPIEQRSRRVSDYTHSIISAPVR